jgi:hypothetical protein
LGGGGFGTAGAAAFGCAVRVRSNIVINLGGAYTPSGDRNLMGRGGIFFEF